MELRQLEYFVAVAEEASFTRAAKRVHISQSGVSAQIRQLERELGTELIDRSGRAATLTAAGEAALEHARAVLASAGAVQQSVGEVTGLMRGRIRVGMVLGCTIAPLFDALSRFHRAHPAIEITVLEDSSDRLIEGVRTGAIQLALVGTAAETPPGLDAFTIVRDRLVVLVPSGHPLANQRRVTLADVSAHPVICMPRGTGIRTVFDQASVAQALEPTIALRASAADAIADLATRGLGVAVLSESMAGAYEGRLIPRLIEDVETHALLALVWADATSPAVRELVAYNRDAFGAARETAASPITRQ